MNYEIDWEQVRANLDRLATDTLTELAQDIATILMHRAAEKTWPLNQ